MRRDTNCEILSKLVDEAAQRYQQHYRDDNAAEIALIARFAPYSGIRDYTGAVCFRLDNPHLTEDGISEICKSVL
jgi:hypothetical protein